MKRKGFYRAAIVLIFIISCREPTLDSAWRNSRNAGEATAKYSSYILNGKDVVAALQNDDKNLYLRIKAINRVAQQKMISGLTIWQRLGE